VQFSQLHCGDLVKRFGTNALEGPKRLPLGLSADPGGIPLYVNGVPVGGVGVESDGLYSLDLDITDTDTAFEERIASAAARGFEAPDDRRADRIGVVGRLLRFADDERFARRALLDFDSQVDGVAGSLALVPGFYDPATFPPDGISRGALFQSPESGVVATLFEGIPAEILTTSGMNRFPPTASALPGGLTADEVRVLLREALSVAQRARAQIRRPPGSVAKVTVHVVDLGGTVLGAVRGRDAPVFGIDVSLQKARTAAFFSSATAGAALTAAPGLAGYVTGTRSFLADGGALANGIAFANRSIGNLARPFFPDGIDGNVNGPLSRPFAEWSPFSTGLQLDLVIGGLAAVLGGGGPTSCTDPALTALANGIQIFPGSVPIFRGAALVGAIGVSGDGVDQDDMTAFLGLHNAGVALGGAIGNAPRPLRADTIATHGVNLRYVSCPFSPFLDSEEQSPCDGK
jgi:uncharacterized protein GlcG (DUF336 family)